MNKILDIKIKAINYDNLTIVLFAFLVTFYYVLPINMAYACEFLVLAFAILNMQDKPSTFVPIIWYFGFTLYIVIDCLLRDYTYPYSSCINVFVFIFISTFLLNTKEKIVLFINYSSYMGLLLALFIIWRYQSFLGIGRLGMQLPGTRIESAITLGYIFLYLLCCQIYSIMIVKNKTEKLLLYFSLFICLYLTILTGTRKAMLLPILYYFFSVYLKYNNRKIVLLMLIPFLLIVLLFLFDYLVSSKIIDSKNLERLQGLFALINSNYSIDSSTLERRSLLNKAILIFEDYPLLGYGIDSTLVKLGKHPHNNFFSLLSMGGILMFIIYYWIYIYAFFSKKIERKSNLSIFIIIAIILPLSDLGTTSYNIIYFNILICLFILYANKAVKI